MNMLRRTAHALLVVLVAFVLAQGTALAQRDNKKKENPYPNATRTEPKGSAVSNEQVRKAYEA